MDWTLEKEQLLKGYIIDYYRKLQDTRLFYKNLDWSRIYSLVGIDDQEFLRLKIDEIYDNHVNEFLGDDFNIEQLILHWESKKNPIFQEVIQMVESLALEEFQLDPPPQSEIVPEQPPQQNVEYHTIPDPVQKVRSTPVPQLTKTERRTSLELMQAKPTFGHHREFQLAKAPTSATTNINVIA